MAGRQLGALNLLLLAATQICTAQEVRVTVRDSAGRFPLTRALVTVHQGRGAQQLHGLTNDAGQVTIRLPSPGDWSVSVRRIGLLPRTSAARFVQVGESVNFSFDMRSVRFVLPPARIVAAAGNCVGVVSGDDRTSALWEQVTLALRAAATADRDRAKATPLLTVAYDRELDRSLKVLSESPVQVRRGFGRPFAALHPDSLAMRGYVWPDTDFTLNYFAPDENTFLSEAFTGTHCFDTPAAKATTGLAELRFVPAPSRQKADIAGTAYVDSATGVLRRIEFRFVNAGSLFPDGTAHAGGDVHFRQLADGEWIVSAWSMRMPRMVRVAWARGPRLTGYREVGGAVDPLVVATTGTEVAAATGRGDASQPASTVRRRDTTGARVAPTGLQIIVGGRRIVAMPERARLANNWRLAFAERRRFGVGVFLDSTDLAASVPRSALELLQRFDGVRLFVVPEDVPAPPRNEDVDLAESWIAGAALPVMSPAGSERATPQCHVKLFLDGARSSAAALRELPGSDVGGAEFYPTPRDVPEGFRRSGNACGTILLWSNAGATVP